MELQNEKQRQFCFQWLSQKIIDHTPLDITDVYRIAFGEEEGQREERVYLTPEMPVVREAMLWAGYSGGNIHRQFEELKQIIETRHLAWHRLVWSCRTRLRIEQSDAFKVAVAKHWGALNTIFEWHSGGNDGWREVSGVIPEARREDMA